MERAVHSCLPALDGRCPERLPDALLPGEQMWGRMLGLPESQLKPKQGASNKGWHPVLGRYLALAHPLMGEGTHVFMCTYSTRTPYNTHT